MPTCFTICPICGKSFHRSPSHKAKYCSSACAYVGIKGSERAPRVLVNCLECGKPIRVTGRRYENGLGRFCSESCRTRHYPHRHPIGTEFRPRVIVPCQTCGKEMRLTEAQARKKKFCSRACVNRGREHPERRVERVTITCEVCGKQFQKLACQLPRAKYCSRECLGYATAIKQGRDKPTSIELMLAEELDRRGVSYLQQLRVPPWIIDIALVDSNIAIEADGDYWHSLKAAKRRDVRKDAALTTLGWRVLRFAEHEIRESPAKCIDKVMAYLAG